MRGMRSDDHPSMDLSYWGHKYLHRYDYNKIYWLIFFLEKIIGINYNDKNMKTKLTIFSDVDVGILIPFLYVY